jgi:hypothetical protein
MSLPEGDTVAAYEGLRSAVVSAQIGGCSGLGILRRSGLATWVREVVGDGQSQIARPDQPLPNPAMPPVTGAPKALADLMAGIVLTLAKETALA